ncbi:MAG TPA: protein-glutamate O-methyltransferase CheR [Vicinamibacterales bacterium]
MSREIHPLHRSGAEPDLTLSDRDLQRIARIVYQRSGITLGIAKRPLIVARLQKRLRAGGFASFASYVRHVESDRTGEEVTALLDAIATNHTSFFREPAHFEFLARRVVPEWRARRTTGLLRGWSAPCATGEEAYSAAITLLEATPAADHSRLSIDAIDISTKAIRTARRAVYPLERVKNVPRRLLTKYFERGLGEQSGLARVAQPVRDLVAIREENLLEIDVTGPAYDFIFCRNVLIYFDRAVQQRVISRLERRLAPGGYLFIAHSESLSGVTHGLEWVAPAIYRRGRS